MKTETPKTENVPAVVQPPPVRLLGLSSDHRTNRWEITCPKCGNAFSPQTTRLSTQWMECPKRKCGAEMEADYNAEPPKVHLLPNVKSGGTGQRKESN
jgi:peptide subunit release factor 1 (eRF1)